MKKILCLFIICVCAISLVAEDKSSREIRKSSEYRDARLNGAETQVLLHVRDDQDAPVADADVLVRMGMTFAEKSYDIKGVTDANGDFAIEGITTGNEIGISLVKTGYYDSHCQLCYADMRAPHDVKDGKWQPYPMERTVTLRKIRNPVALCRCVKTLTLHATNQWVGVDMKIGDFVKPNGTGEVADFHVLAQWDGLIDLKSELCVADIKFADPLSGGYFVGKCLESEYPYAYFAVSNADYQSNLYVQNRKGEFYSTHKPFNKLAIFVTRSRCRVDENGVLKSANYGCVRRFDVTPGDWGNGVNVIIDAIFNPVPNDTNLEDEEVSRRNERSRKSRQCRGDEPK